MALAFPALGIVGPGPKGPALEIDLAPIDWPTIMIAATNLCMNLCQLRSPLDPLGLGGGPLELVSALRRPVARNMSDARDEGDTGIGPEAFH